MSIFPLHMSSFVVSRAQRDEISGSVQASFAYGFFVMNLRPPRFAAARAIGERLHAPAAISPMNLMEDSRRNRLANRHPLRLRPRDELRLACDEFRAPRRPLLHPIPLGLLNRVMS